MSQQIISINFFLILFLISSGVSAQHEHLLHKTFAQRSVYLDEYYEEIIVNEDSISIFKAIDSFRDFAIANGDDELMYEAELMKAHYFYYRNRSPEIVIPMFDSLIAIGKEKNILWLQTRSEMISGIYHFITRHQYELGFLHFEKTYQLLKKQTPLEYPHKQICLYVIADAYYKFSEYPRALSLFKEAIQATSKYDRHRYYMNAHNSTGLCYQRLGMTDSSDYYFQIILNKAITEKDSVWIGIASGNIGYNYFIRKDFDTAVPFLEKDVSIAERYEDWGLAVGSLLPLAAINLERTMIPQAEIQLLKAKSYIEKSGQYHRNEKLYPLLAKLYTLKGKPLVAAKYIDLAFEVNDSLARKFNLLQMARAEQKLSLEQYNSAILLLESKQKLKVMERNILLAIVSILALTSILVYRNRQLKYLEKKHALQQTENELHDASRKLLEFAKSIAEKNTQIDELQHQASEIHTNENDEVIIQLQQNPILTEEQWTHFKHLFEKVHPGFFKRMKEKLPGLTPAEIRFIALSKLELTPKEMTSILGIGRGAIRQYRIRLRKKLDLSKDGMLENLIETI